MITENMLSALRLCVADHMDENRYRHTLGVEKEMRILAKFFLPEKEAEAAAAGLLHDITKRLSYEEQLSYADEHGIFLDEDERNVPPVIHAKTGAHYVKTHFPEFATPQILHAIEVHTLAAEAMSVFDMMLFLADFTEENRTYDDCVSLRRTLHDGLSFREDKEAFLYEMVSKACDASISDLIANGRPIALKTVQARNEALRFAVSNKGKK